MSGQLPHPPRWSPSPASPTSRPTTEAVIARRPWPAARRAGRAPVHDGGAGRARDAVVVGLAQAPDRADAGLGQEVHGQVGQALLSDDQVRLVPRDLRALPLHCLLLQLQQRRPAARALAWGATGWGLGLR